MGFAACRKEEGVISSGIDFYAPQNFSGKVRQGKGVLTSIFGQRIREDSSGAVHKRCA